METYDISRILDNEWRHGITYLTGNGWGAEVIALFDHDYEYHLLLMVFPDDGKSYYALFFIGINGACLVKRWHEFVSRHPWVEAAEVVSGWSELGRLAS